jgi:tripartite-type tricarboxylate transporter receptor subunit TctC
VTHCPIFSAVAFVVAAVTAPASAAQYPSRPIRFVIPFPAGGASDAASRIIAQALGPSLGHPIVSDNRPGAEGAIGAEIVMRAPADGYTLLVGSSSSMAAVPATRKNPPYNAVTDFAPISLLGNLSFLMVVHPGLPVKSVSDFIAYARANPSKVNVAAANAPAIFAIGQLKSIGKFETLDIQYKGGAAAMPDLLTGRVHVLVAGTNLVLPFVRDGKLRAFAVLSESRTRVAPDVPTMAEAGAPQFSVYPWVALFAPAKTPADIVQKVAQEVNAVLQKPDLRPQFEKVDFDAQGSTPQQLSIFLKRQISAWHKVARDIGIPQQ